MTTPEPGRSFWQWSLDHYAKDGVSTALLRLQDDINLNVNILLWCIWSARDYEEIPDLAMRKAHDLTTSWSSGIAQGLRQVRRALKTPPRQVDAEKAGALRKAVKKAELDAEEIEQNMLEKLAADALSISASPTAHESRARRNLVQYAALAGAAKHPNFGTHLLENLITSIFAESQLDDADKK